MHIEIEYSGKAYIGKNKENQSEFFDTVRHGFESGEDVCITIELEPSIYGCGAWAFFPMDALKSSVIKLVP